MADTSCERSARGTVAILGDCPVTCHAIAQLLRSRGYEARLVDTVRGETAPGEPELVLLTAMASPDDDGPRRLVAGSRALRLVDTPEEAERMGEKALLWPCAAEELCARVDALVSAGAAPL